MAANREISSGNRWYKPFEPESKGKQRNYIGQTAIINQKTQIPAGSIVGMLLVLLFLIFFGSLITFLLTEFQLIEWLFSVLFIVL